MLRVSMTSKFLKDVNKAKCRNLDLDKLDGVILRLVCQLPLERKFNDHKLEGVFCNYKQCRECRIEPDWLLIYKICKNELKLILLRAGIHSDLY